MIRRITKNDLKDIIRSIPPDVINNIKEVRYYVYGYENKFIAPEFTQEGDILKVIIPAEDLETLPDGLLYRQCLYNKEDADYPDGVYNLSITDNLDLWIYSKENSVQPPIGNNYLQEDDLKTINGESLVGKGDMAVQKPIDIGIDIDSGQLIGITYDDYKANIDEYADDGGYTKKLMIYLESATTGLSCGSYPSDIDFNTREIGGYFLDNRDENNKRLVYYRIKGNDATQKIELTLTPVPSNADIPDLTGYATETWVESKGYLTEHQSLADYALKSEIPDVSSYALKSEIPSLDGYATETWVESKGYLTEHQTLKTINGESIVGEGNIVITGGSSEEVISIPFDDYQLSMTHQELVDNVLNKIDGKPVGSYKIFFVNSNGCYYEADTINIIHNISVGGSSGGTDNDTGVYIYSNAIRLNFYLKFENIEFIFDEFAYSVDLDYLGEQISTLESRIPDLTGYATESWVESKGYLTEHQDLSSYALKSEIPSLAGYATESWVESKGYLTEHQDLSGYALKSEIPSLTGYATESWVTNQGYAAQTYVDNKIGQIDTLLDQMLG